MLVLVRKERETIHIGDNITVTVLEIRGDKCRLGIDCPRDIPVHRAEVYAAIKAAGSDPVTREGGMQPKEGAV